ncbi:MAG TPA: cytosine permease [Candidatus Limnocylindrales bacterium]|jgi:NCS1 family nucleobase:cation symporter-1
MVVEALTRDTMPSGEGDLSIEGHGIEPIPASARYGSVWRLFTVWFTPNLVPAAFALGALAAVIGLGFVTGFLAIIVGNIIGGGIVAILSTIGPKVGLGQIPITRLSFGKSIVVPGLINWVSTIAWDAINAFFGAYAIQVITGGAIPFWLGLLLVIVCQAGLSVVGYEAIHTFEKYAAIGLAILFAVVTIALLPKANFGMVGSGDGLANFILVTTIVGSFNLGWALYASDYSRYLPASTPSSKVALYSFLGIALSAVWIELLGLATVGAVTDATVDPVHQIDALLGGGLISAVAMIAIFFGTVAVNAMNDYSGSLSLLAAGIKVWRPVSALIVGVLSFIATLWLYSQNFNSTFESYLLLITYWIGPWSAIVLVDWQLRRHSAAGADHVSNFSLLPSGRNALIALILGFVISIPFISQYPTFVGWAADKLGGADIAYVIGFIVAAVVYWALERSSPSSVPA